MALLSLAFDLIAHLEQKWKLILLLISGCGDVEIEHRALNPLPYMKNLTLTKLQRVHLHTKMFESRVGDSTRNLANFEISAVRWFSNFFVSVDTVAAIGTTHIQ